MYELVSLFLRDRGGRAGEGNEGICEAEQRMRRVRKGDEGRRNANVVRRRGGERT